MINELKFKDIIKTVEIKNKDLEISYTEKNETDIFGFDVKQKHFFLKYNYKTINYDVLLDEHLKMLLKKETIKFYLSGDYIEDVEHIKRIISNLTDKLLHKVGFLSGRVITIVGENNINFFDDSYKEFFHIMYHKSLYDEIIMFVQYDEDRIERGYKLFHNKENYTIDCVIEDDYEVIELTTLREEREKKLKRIRKKKFGIINKN
jgi:hypothetical protein